MKTSPKSPSRKQNTDLLQRGILCALIGLAVLISPSFMAPTGMREAVAGSALVGWFALVLGVAFLGLYARRRVVASRQQP
jgi:hypothetical protein